MAAGLIDVVEHGLHQAACFRHGGVPQTQRGTELLAEQVDDRVGTVHQGIVHLYRAEADGIGLVETAGKACPG